MIKNGTYHRQMGLPGENVPFSRTLELVYSEHALKAAAEDRYGKVPLFGSVEFESSDIVEVTFENGVAVKGVLRIPFDDDDSVNARDLVYVLMRPVNGVALVKTVWFNLRRDAHRTLDRSKYVRI